MSNTLAGPPRSRLPLGLLAVLLVHLGWFWLLRHEARPALPPVRTLTELRLVPLPPSKREPQRPPANPGVTRSGLSRPVPLMPPLPGPAAEVSALPALPAAPVVAPTAPIATRAPLNLALPPERAASGPRPESLLSRMLNDPRANSPKRTLEAAIADAAGTLPVESQVATDGTQTRLFRQGSKCVRVTEARVATLNPMDERARGAAAAVGSCD